MFRGEPAQARETDDPMRWRPVQPKSLGCGFGIVVRVIVLRWRAELPCTLVVLGAKNGDERFLGNIDAAELLHFCLPLFLLFEQLLLARHVAAI